MSYATINAKQTGIAGEFIADFYLRQHGYKTDIPEGKDEGIDLLVYTSEKPEIRARIQVKSRGQVANPRWFQLTVPPSWIEKAKENLSDLNQLWVKRIEMVDFFMMVSLPLAEVWMFPSAIVKAIAEENAQVYHTRLDNDYSALHYNRDGRLARKQKELNLDIADRNGQMLWKKYWGYRNNLMCLGEYFKQRKGS